MVEQQEGGPARMIRIDRAAAGYRRGHEVFACSAVLDRTEAVRLAERTDLTGYASDRDWTRYHTACPVGRFYMLAEVSQDDRARCGGVFTSCLLLGPAAQQALAQWVMPGGAAAGLLSSPAALLSLARWVQQPPPLEPVQASEVEPLFLRVSEDGAGIEVCGGDQGWQPLPVLSPATVFPEDVRRLANVFFGGWTGVRAGVQVPVGGWPSQRLALCAWLWERTPPLLWWSGTGWSTFNPGGVDRFDLSFSRLWSMGEVAHPLPPEVFEAMLRDPQTLWRLDAECMRRGVHLRRVQEISAAAAGLLRDGVREWLDGEDKSDVVP